MVVDRDSRLLIIGTNCCRHPGLGFSVQWLLSKALCWFGGQRKSIRSGLVCFYSLRPVGHGAWQQALKRRLQLLLLPKGAAVSRQSMQGMLVIIY